MAEEYVNKIGRIVVAIAVIAGGVFIVKVLRRYDQGQPLDIFKIALGVGVPCLLYAIVRRTEINKNK